MPSSSFLFRLLAQGRVGGRSSTLCAGSRGEAASRHAGTSAASPQQPWPPTTTLSTRQGCGCLRGIAKCGGWHLFLNVPRPPNWEPTQEVKQGGGNRGFLQATWLLSAPTPSPNASGPPLKTHLSRGERGLSAWWGQGFGLERCKHSGGEQGWGCPTRQTCLMPPSCALTNG